MALGSKTNKRLVRSLEEAHTLHKDELGIGRNTRIGNSTSKADLAMTQGGAEPKRDDAVFIDRASLAKVRKFSADGG